MYRWMSWNFNDCIDYNEAAFSTELLEWGSQTLQHDSLIENLKSFAVNKMYLLLRIHAKCM